MTTPPMAAAASRLTQTRMTEPYASRELLTIGHSTHALGEFLALLRGANVQAIADVRRFPGSRRHPHFGAEALAAALRAAAIDYPPVAGLGGRRSVARDSPNDGWEVAAFRAYA